MSEYRTANRTAAYQLSKDMKAQERKHKEAQKLAKKRKQRNVDEAFAQWQESKRRNK